MGRMILAELRGRFDRSLALLAGVVLACAGFVVLVSTARTEQLAVHGTVARTFRSSYDILVRPAGTETPLEKRQRLVRDNYQSGIFGGITLSQWQAIARVPGVAVAAPIAMVGYVLQPINFGLDLTRYLSSADRQLFSVRVDRTTDRGLVHLVDQPGYVYVTRRPIVSPNGKPESPYNGDEEKLATGRDALVCPRTENIHGTARSTFGSSERNLDVCWSHRTGFDGTGWRDLGFVPGHLVVSFHWSFPFLLAAIDPASEAKLDGLNRTIIGGRYLRGGDAPTAASSAGVARTDVPVVVSTRPYVDDSDQVSVRALAGSAAQAMSHSPTPRRVARLLAAARPGRLVERKTVGVEPAYRQLLAAIFHQQIAVIQNYWTSGPTRYRQLGARELTPLPVRNPPSVWRSDYEGTGVVDAPIDAEMTDYRTLHPHVGLADQQTLELPTLRAVGRFDPTKLAGFSPLSRVPQETYSPPVAAPADARTRRLLHGQSLQPDGNLAGYLQSPPLMLTDINSLSAFNNPSAFPTTDATAPVSVIRVRVAGVRGDDPLSLARVRAVAQEIARRTNLQVDITIGSSPTPVTIDLPADRYRPALKLSEGWVKEGVSVSILRAIDRKSQVLVLLILLVGALFVANAASASVRARRSELGVLAAIGWGRRQLFGAIVGELVIIGLLGGLVALILALIVVSALGDHVQVFDAVVAVPAAAVIVGLAGVVPALRASAAQPLAAVRPPVLEAARARHAQSLLQLSLVNLVRVPGRSLFGALSLTIGVAALTVLLGATVAFKNLLIGTLLGGAVSVQVSGSDFASVAIIIVLALGAIADVLYLNQRERAGEMATLLATGWTRGTLSRLTTMEAGWIAAGGSVAGGGLGLAITASLSGSVPTTLLLTTTAAVGAGTLGGLLAALGPAVWLSRLPVAGLLAAE